MAPSYPFIDNESGGLDTDQVLAETYPLVGLVALFGGVALVPFLFSLVVGVALGSCSPSPHSSSSPSGRASS